MVSHYDHRGGFLKRHMELLNLTARFGDILAVILGSLAASVVRFGDAGLTTPHQIAVVLAVLISLVVFPMFQLYKPWRASTLGSEARTVVLAWLTVAVIGVLIAYLTKSGTQYSRLWIGYWTIATSSSAAGSRCGSRCGGCARVGTTPARS